MPPRAFPLRAPAFRGGRRGAAARLDQRAGAGPLPGRVGALRALRSRVARPRGVSPSAAVRILGARRLPGAHHDAAVVAARDAGLSRPPHRLVRLAAAQRQGPHAGQGDRRVHRPDGPRRLRRPAPVGQERLVVVEARPARLPLSVDDGGVDRALAPALQQALRFAGALPARRQRLRGRFRGNVPALARRAVVARDGRGDGAGPDRLHDVSALRPRRSARGAAGAGRARRGHRGCGRGLRRALVCADA